MKNEKKIPNSFLENINIVNTASNFFKTNNISDENTFFQTPNNYTQFSNSNNNYNNFKTTKKINIEKKNSNKKFGWKEIMNLNYDEIKYNENALNNPLIKNVLHSKIDEKEIQNIPESYLVNLIQTLQGLANNALKEKDILQYENKKLYNDLEEMKTNNEYLQKNNSKTAQKLLKLKENEKNFYLENNYNAYMNNLNINKTLHKKRYYCEICSNKKFKTQKYLDEHYIRRHPDYNRNKTKNKNNENKLAKESFENKLNDMKKYFENLISKSFRKMQYIKINEKINNLQNLIEISKLNSNNNNNININNNINNSLTENDEINNDINISLHKENESQKNSSNNINGNSNINLIKVNSNNNNSNNLSNEKSEENNKKKSKEEIKRKRFKDDYTLVKKQIKFHNIKKNFFTERNEIRHKTLNHSSKLWTNNESNEKEKNNKINFLKGKKKEINEQINNGDNKENKDIEIDIENKNKDKDKKSDEEDENSINSKKSQKGNSLFENEKISPFTDKEDSPKKKRIQKFFEDFRRRDGNLSKQKVENYMQNVLPSNYQVDEEKINNIIDKKINSKLKNYHFDRNSNEQMRSDIMQIYYETFDYYEKYGNIYLYFCLNQGNLFQVMNINNLLLDANNFDDNLFENVQYQLEEEEDFSFGRYK